MVDIKLLVIGMEDIDRKRAIIKRVIKTICEFIYKYENYEHTIIPLSNNFSIKVHRCQEIFYPNLIGTKYVAKIYYYIGDTSAISVNKWEDLENNESPINEVQIVYDHLPKIIDAIDKICSELGINNHFNLTVEHAKNLS